MANKVPHGSRITKNFTGLLLGLSISISSNSVLLIVNNVIKINIKIGVKRKSAVLAREEIGDMAKGRRSAFLKPQFNVFFKLYWRSKGGESPPRAWAETTLHLIALDQ